LTNLRGINSTIRESELDLKMAQ